MTNLSKPDLELRLKKQRAWFNDRLAKEKAKVSELLKERNRLRKELAKERHRTKGRIQAGVRTAMRRLERRKCDEDTLSNGQAVNVEQRKED